MGATDDTPSVITREVRTFAELEAAVARLPPPIDGKLRVFRGQTREYPLAGSDAPSISPSIMRTPWLARDVDPVWLMAAIDAIRSHLNVAIEDFFELRDLWAPAILQHYGARSAFVDVTRDVQVGLWFALHEFELRWLSVLPQMTMGWVPARVAIAGYGLIGRHHETAVVYVIDAPRWRSELRVSGVGLTVGAHGVIVEVADAKGGGMLERAATRLKRQRASLLWCDVNNPDAGSLHKLVVARFRLAPGFESSGAPRAEAGLAAMFPGPDDDPCYRALLQLPPTLTFNPEYAQHPLDIPLYMSRDWPDAAASSGNGSFESPFSVGRLDGTDGNSGSPPLASYVALMPQRSPALLHRELLLSRASGSRVAAPLQVNDRQFAIENALPILADSPWWHITPSTTDSGDRGMWIDSAIRLGLPDVIDGRSVESVYVELSALDSPGMTANPTPFAIRGVWMVRNGDTIAVRVFGVVDGIVQSATARFSWHPTLGTLQPVALRGLPSGSGSTDPLLKSALVVLAVLRQLNPGFKPPAAHLLRVKTTVNGTEVNIYQPGLVLEPQAGRPEWVAGTPYLRPRAMDGSVYAFASGHTGDRGDSLSARDRLALWAIYVPQITDPCYSVAAGIPLAEHYAFFEDFDAAVEAVQRARRRVHDAGLPIWDDRLDILEAQLEISREHIDAARGLLRGVASRARDHGNHELALAVGQLSARPVKNVWGRVEDYGPMRLVKPPDDSPAVLFN